MCDLQQPQVFGRYYGICNGICTLLWQMGVFDGEMGNLSADARGRTSSGEQDGLAGRRPVALEERK